jgi:peptidoglycan/LPS O-acetylase OafA/YrhL
MSVTATGLTSDRRSTTRSGTAARWLLFPADRLFFGLENDPTCRTRNDAVQFGVQSRLTDLLGLLGANRWLMTAGLCALLVVDILYYTNRIWMPQKFILNAVVSSQIIAFVLLADRQAAGWLLWRPLLRLGDISFSSTSILFLCSSS